MMAKVAGVEGGGAGSNYPRQEFPYVPQVAYGTLAGRPSAASSCAPRYKINPGAEVQIAFKAYREEPEKAGVNEIVVLGNVQNAGEKGHRCTKAAMVSTVRKAISKINNAVIELIPRHSLHQKPPDLIRVARID